MNNLAFLLFSCLVFSCDYRRESVDSSGNSHAGAQRSRPVFDQSKTLTLLSAELNKENPDVQADTAECLKWSLSHAEVLELLSNLPPISRSDWHDRFEILPCEIEGTFVQNGDTFSFGINGGSFMTIGIADTFYFYGDLTSRYSSLFLYPALEQNPSDQ
jgi:hypothetical protein